MKIAAEDYCLEVEDCVLDGGGGGELGGREGAEQGAA